ncbi:MAG TPA: hypothetical protein VNE62_04580 [Actinomycetota bacterium]|nr:hypothetical protein [Actinomycetota bacterium]
MAGSPVPEGASITSVSGATPVGQCDFCHGDIVVPREVLVWVDDHSYHRGCYQAHLARSAVDEGIRPAI